MKLPTMTLPPLIKSLFTVTVFVWGSASIIAWDMWPGTWPGLGRFFAVLVWGVAVIAIFFHNEETEGKG